MLFFDHMLTRTTDQRERIVLLQHAIDDIVGTFYRQCLFADYELQAHRLAEQGEPITAEALSRMYFDLFKAYHGDAMTYDDSAQITWARVPHFFGSPYYVYQYATCYASSAQLIQTITSGSLDERRAGRRAVSRAAARRRQRLPDEPSQACGRRPEHACAGRSGRRAARQARDATGAGNWASIIRSLPQCR